MNETENDREGEIKAMADVEWYLNLDSRTSFATRIGRGESGLMEVSLN